MKPTATNITAINKHEKIIPREVYKILSDLGLYPVPIRWNVKNKAAEVKNGHPRHVEETIDGKPSMKDIDKWCSNGMADANGVAVKLFQPWGMIDFDIKNSLNKLIYETWSYYIKTIYPEIWAKICVEGTRNNGYHVYFKYSGVLVSKKLLKENKHEVIAIKTGGLLSYSSPTPGYTLLYNNLDNVQELTEDEFNILCDYAEIPAPVDEEEKDYPSGDFLYVFNQIIAKGIDITQDYNERWIPLGFALANEFGENGREYYHELCKFHPGYNHAVTDNKFDSFVRSKGFGRTISTFFYFAKEAGIEINPTPIISNDCFSDEVYANLPKEIREICFLIEDHRKRDVLLIGILTALSAAFSRWRFLHGSDTDISTYSPHLCSLVVGVAGSGKGLTRYGYKLIAPISQEAKKLAEASIQKYKSDKVKYDSLIAAYKKVNKSVPTGDFAEPEFIEPSKPPKITFSISVSDCTQASLVEVLYHNPVGCFGHESEVDTMVQGNSREFGGFGDVIRKAFHHEPLARQRKEEKESYIVQQPRLAFMLSGTADQLRKLIPSEQNGLFSRIWYYAIPTEFIPYKVATQKEDIIGEKIGSLSFKVFELADLWNGELNYLEFSDSQENDLFLAMRDKQEIEKIFGGEVSATWLRAALITKRIAVTLAAFEYIGENIIPENCWAAAMALLPSIKQHAISALNIVRQNNGKKIISKDEYVKLKDEGLTQDEIAARMGVTRPTLNKRKKEWGL